MTRPADTYTYTPRAWRKRFHTQAVSVWIITVSVVLLWLVSIIAAPLLRSSAIYSFFSYLCHQIAERSLYIAGLPMAVCSRCFGVYAGLLIGIAVYPLWQSIDETEPVSRTWLFLSIVPIAIDWSLTAFGVWENTHISRFATGAILGGACATFIVPALVDITRNLTTRRVRSK